MRLWRGEDDKTEAQALEWPEVVARGAPLIALSFLALTVAVRAANGEFFPAVAFAALAALPWVVHLSRRFPEPGPWIFCVTVGIAYFVFWPEEQEFSPFVMVLATGEVAATTNRRAGIAAMVAFGSVIVAGEAAGRYDGGLVWLAALVVGWATGATYQHIVRLYTDLQRAQAGLAAKAVAEERGRIAREVHDVIAHSLAVTLLNVTGARMAVERGDVDDAVAALHDAERLGRQSLTDVRRTVGLLGSPTGDAGRVEPAAADIPELVESYRSAGLAVVLRVDGDVAALPLSVGLGLYRVTQEALANVVRHAPGTAAVVELAVNPHGARLCVTNDGGPPPATARDTGGGRGLAGIRERAELLDGLATVGPTATGWRVELAIPVIDAEEPAGGRA